MAIGSGRGTVARVVEVEVDVEVEVEVDVERGSDGLGGPTTDAVRNLTVR